MKISIIVSMDKKRGIGKDNKLLFRIPEDMKRFRKLTIGHPIIMGRKTFESIGRPLPNRTNIIITHDVTFNPHKFCYRENCDVCMVHFIGEAIEKGKKSPRNDEIFIIGGGQIFEQALPLVDKLYLTIVEGDFGADTFFPDYSEFKKVVFRKRDTSSIYKYEFLELER